MTEWLQQLIVQIEMLPADRQDAIVTWFLVQLQEEQNSSVIDTSDSWTEEDRLNVIDFSLQHVVPTEW